MRVFDRLTGNVHESRPVWIITVGNRLFAEQKH